MPSLHQLVPVIISINTLFVISRYTCKRALGTAELPFIYWAANMLSFHQLVPVITPMART